MRARALDQGSFSDAYFFLPVCVCLASFMKCFADCLSQGQRNTKKPSKCVIAQAGQVSPQQSASQPVRPANKPASKPASQQTSHCIVLYYIVLYCIVLYCIVLYCIVLYCIVLYYFISCYIIIYDNKIHRSWP